MTSSTHPDDVPTNAGSSTDQHVTSAADPDPFTTDDPPAGGTPVHGSSNAGFNAAGANRPDLRDDPADGSAS